MRFEDVDGCAANMGDDYFLTQLIIASLNYLYLDVRVTLFEQIGDILVQIQKGTSLANAPLQLDVGRARSRR